MSVLCEQLTAFADGELSDAEHTAFQEHFAGCRECQRGLLDHWNLEAAADRVLGRRRRPDAGLLIAALVVVGVMLAVAILLSSCAPGCPPVAERAPVADVGDGFSRGHP